MFTIFLKISLNLWVFEHLWKTHLWNPFSTFFYLPWHFLLSHLGSSHFMGNMNPQLSGMMRRDFSKTHLSMLQTLPPRTSRWVHFLFLLVNLLILASYLRNLWWFVHLEILGYCMIWIDDDCQIWTMLMIHKTLHCVLFWEFLNEFVNFILSMGMKILGI